MTMVLKGAGATPDEIAKGLRAAQAVLDAAGVTAEQGARAQFALEGWGIVHGLKDNVTPSDAIFDAAAALDQAREAAIAASCEGWAEQPAEWSLDVLFGPPEAIRSPR